MTINDKYRIKRMALGMTQKEFGAIADVDEGIISLFERGEYINGIEYEKIKYNVENYIRSFNREKYLTTRIMEETLMFRNETDEHERHKILSHLMIHVSKLNMDLVNPEYRKNRY